MTVRVRQAGYGAPALGALRAAVADAKRGDPMSPVLVIAPNNLAGIVARRHLAHGTAGSPGIAGIEVTTLPRLAERVATPLLAPRRPATSVVLAAAWRRALAADPRVFRDIADHPATVRALVAVHAHLRDLSAAGRQAVKASTPVAHDLVTLFEQVVAALRNEWYDTTDVLTVAAQHPPVTGACILYAPQDLTRAEADFAVALAGSGDLEVIAALTGAPRADRAVHQTLERVGATVPEAKAEFATASRVINASDSDDEVRCVVRDLMVTLQRTPAHRVAVLYSAPVPYARLLHEHLTAAGVTVNGRGVRTLDERAVARTLREILALTDDLPRNGLFRALAGAPTRNFGGERIPVARWERLSRSAGVVHADDWQARLDAFIDDRRAEAASHAGADDPQPWLVERYEREAEAAAELRDFAVRLRGELAGAQRMTTWRALGHWALTLFTALLGDEAALGRLPVEEQHAAASVRSLLSGLQNLDSVDESAGFDALRDVLDTQLAAGLPRVGRFGEGVLVAPISAAVGLDLDVVYLVGLSEDLYPGRVHADALLPDRARLASGGELPAQREYLDTRYRHLLAAFACAGQSVASFPRGNLRRSTRRPPSRWLLATLRRLSGNEALAATAWDKVTYSGAVATAGSFAGELLHTDRLATEQEWRVRQALAGRLDDEIARAAADMIRARASRELTRFDGNLSGVAGLPDYAEDDRLISPTALEGYARCPHAFFVERLLGVKPLDQPEDVVTISALDIGNLIHESVDALITEFAGSLPAEGRPWTPAQRARLIEIAAEKAEQFRLRGLTGHPRLWARERGQILDDVGWLIDDDDRWRAKEHARVLASELAFGLDGQPPVEVAVAGGRVRMRGSADKVDRAADGTILVTDIKTGSDYSFKAIKPTDPTARGSKLQLPVYAYAARERFGDATTPVRAAYWFVRKNRGNRVSVDLTPEVEQTYARAVTVLVRSIAEGLFPPRAPVDDDFGGYTQCEYCNPDGIGYVDTRERWLRKRLDPALADYVLLVEPDALAGDQ